MVKQSFEDEKSRSTEFNELSKEHQDAIYELERGDISRHDTFAILGAFLGYKFSWIPVHGRSLEDVEKKSQSLEVLFSKFGLKYIKATKAGDEYSTTEYILGKETIPHIAQKYLLHSVVEAPDQAVYHTEFGTLMGIPQSAIQKWVERQANGDFTGAIPDVIPQAEVEKIKGFLWFTPSEENWQEEIKPAIAFAQKVKGISPVLYEKIRT